MKFRILFTRIPYEMEYFNDRTYARGEDVEIEIPIEPESAKTGDGQSYDFNR